MARSKERAHLERMISYWTTPCKCDNMRRVEVCKFYSNVELISKVMYTYIPFAFEIRGGATSPLGGEAARDFAVSSCVASDILLWICNACGYESLQNSINVKRNTHKALDCTFSELRKRFWCIIQTKSLDQDPASHSVSKVTLCSTARMNHKLMWLALRLMI